MNAPTPHALMVEASMQAITSFGSFTTVEAIPELLQALSTAQGKFTTVLHNCKGVLPDAGPDGEPVEFGYADLDAYIEASRGHLKEAGLAVSFIPVTHGPDRRALRMYVTHLKGGYLMGEMDFPFINDGYLMEVMQATATAMTLLRRNLYKSLLNLSDREDTKAVDQQTSTAKVSASRSKAAEHEGLKSSTTIGELSRVFRALPAPEKAKYQDYFNRRQKEIVATTTKESEAHGS